MDPLISAILAAVGAGGVSAFATVSALRVELRWLRRDVDKLNKRVFPTDTAPFPHHSIDH